MVVVIVAKQYGGDRREIFEAYGRLANPARSKHAHGTGLLRVHRVGQKIAGRCLNQKSRVTNERNRGCIAGELGWSLQPHIDAARPRRPSLAQHAQHGRERLSSRPRRIDESRSVEVIAQDNNCAELPQRLLVAFPSNPPAAGHAAAIRGRRGLR